MSPWRALLSRELDLAFGRGGGPLLSVGFMTAATVLIPLASGAATGKLAVLAAASTWVTLALSNLLSLERLFERDFEDGALDLLCLGPVPLEAVCAIKGLAQWLANGLPLAAFAPVAAIVLGAPVSLAPLIAVVSLIGGLAFAFVGGLGAALSLGAKRGGVLIAILVLPLFAPPIIFGGGAVDAFASGLNWSPGLLLLAAYALAAAALTPFAMAAAVRNALS